MSKLYILTLNFNGENKLKFLAPSLIKATKNIEYEWIVKDNNSSDNSLNYLKSLNISNINVISYKNNLQNFSQGMNYIFNTIQPHDDDNILLLNNDIIFNDSISLKNMINIMQDSEVGVVGAKLLYTNTNKLQHAGVVFHKDHKLPYHFRSKCVDDVFSSKNRQFQAVTGAVMLTKAKYYKEINKMDENYQWAFEDVDLCLSIHHILNKKIVYCGNTHIFHEESATLKESTRNFFIKHNINYFLKKWGGRYIIDDHNYMNNNYNLYNSKE